MTHDELLGKVDWIENTATPTEHCEVELCELNLRQLASALRAVVELHKPIVYAQTQLRCPICVWSDDWDAELYSYPCPTIQAIEKELA